MNELSLTKLKWTSKECPKSAVLFVYFLYKIFEFYLKMTADFLYFGQSDQKRKMEWTWHNVLPNEKFAHCWPRSLTAEDKFFSLLQKNVSIVQIHVLYIIAIA